MKFRDQEDFNRTAIMTEIDQLLQLRRKRIQIQRENADTPFAIIADGSRFIFIICGYDGTFYIVVLCGTKYKKYQIPIPRLPEHERQNIEQRFHEKIKTMSWELNEDELKVIKSETSSQPEYGACGSMSTQTEYRNNMGNKREQTEEGIITAITVKMV